MNSSRLAKNSVYLYKHQAKPLKQCIKKLFVLDFEATCEKNEIVSPQVRQICSIFSSQIFSPNIFGMTWWMFVQENWDVFFNTTWVRHFFGESKKNGMIRSVSFNYNWGLADCRNFIKYLLMRKCISGILVLCPPELRQFLTWFMWESKIVIRKYFIISHWRLIEK